MTTLMTPVDTRYTGIWGVYPSGGVHRAIDYPLPIGTPVRALDSGVVTTAGWSATGFGRHVRIKMDQTGHTVILAHLDSIGVKVGQRVAMGAIIGRSGNTGRSTGPHLHVEVRTSSWSPLTAYNFTGQLFPPAKIIRVADCRLNKDNATVPKYQRLLWGFQNATQKAAWKAGGNWDFDTKGFVTTYGPATAKLTAQTYKRLNGSSSTEPGPWLISKLGGGPV